MLGAGVAQSVGDPGRGRVEGGHGRVLRIQQAQDVTLEPPALDLRQSLVVGAVVGGQLHDVGRTARGVTDRVEKDLDAVEPGLPVEARPELDDLGVDRRPRVADRLDVELPELAVAAGLRPVVAEHRPDLGQLDRLRPGLHPVLDVGAHDPGGRLGAQCPGLAILGPWRQAEELLLDDVGDLADPTLEDVGQLEHRRLDAPVAVARRQVGREPLEARPGRRVGRQQVPGATCRTEGWHLSRCRAGR